MLKPLTVVVILVVAAVALTNGQESNEEAGSPEVSDPQASNQQSDGPQASNPGNTNQLVVVPNETLQDTSIAASQAAHKRTNNGLLSTLLNTPIIGNLLEEILSPLGSLLDPIIHLLDVVLTPLNVVLSPVLSTVSLILAPVNLLLAPIVTPLNWLLGGLDDLLTSLLSGVSKLLSLLLSNVSGLLSILLGRVTAIQAIGPPARRRRRGLMDSFMGMMLRMTLKLPLKFARSFLGFFLSPFGFIYDIIMWPFHLIFGGNEPADDLANLNALATSIPFYADISTYVNNAISSFLLNLSESSQAAVYEALIQGWSLTKTNILPALDDFIVKAVDSGWVPDDIAKTINQIHTVYKWIHVLGLI